MEGKKLLYIVTNGPSKPQRIYTALMLAITAAASDAKPKVYFVLDGVMALATEAAAQAKLEAYPSLLETITQAQAVGVEIYACEDSLRLSGLGQRDLVDGVKIVGSVSLNEMLLEADASVSF